MEFKGKKKERGNQSGPQSFRTRKKDKMGKDLGWTKSEHNKLQTAKKAKKETTVKRKRGKLKGHYRA